MRRAARRADRTARRVRGLLMGAGLAGLLLSAVPAGASVRRAAWRPITLEWVGDIALSTQRGLPPGGLVHALAPVRAELRRADLTAGNLEGTLSTGGRPKCGAGSSDCFAFQAPPAFAGQLHALGFGLLNMANNHSFDFGASGRRQTIEALDSAGIAHDGLPGEITIRRVRGERVAFVGFAPYSLTANLLDIGAARALVRRARSLATIVVVIIHAGAEGPGALHTPYGEEHFAGEDRGNPRAFAHAVIDAGASIVLGSGPHVIRGIEEYREHLIAYSLGNFVGYHTLGDSGVLADSAILRVTLGRAGRVIAGRWLPIRIVGGLPRPDPTHASTRLMIALSDEDFPRDHYEIDSRGIFHVGVRRR